MMCLSIGPGEEQNVKERNRKKEKRRRKEGGRGKGKEKKTPSKASTKKDLNKNNILIYYFSRLFSETNKDKSKYQNIA